MFTIEFIASTSQQNKNVWSLYIDFTLMLSDSEFASQSVPQNLNFFIALNSPILIILTIKYFLGAILSF